MQLATVAGVLATAITRLWSSVFVLAIMFAVAAVTVARPQQSQARIGLADRHCQRPSDQGSLQCLVERR